MELYLNQNGQQVGPYSRNQVVDALNANQITRGELTWYVGLAEWQSIETVLNLPPALKSIPLPDLSPRPPEFGHSLSPTPGPPLPTNKQGYLTRIRHSSSYPVYRKLVGWVAALFFVIGGVTIGLSAISAVSVLFTEKLGAFNIAVASITLLIGILFGTAPILIGRLIKEMSLMFADAVDSITDLNARYDRR